MRFGVLKGADRAWDWPVISHITKAFEEGLHPQAWVETHIKGNGTVEQLLHPGYGGIKNLARRHALCYLEGGDGLEAVSGDGECPSRHGAGQDARGLAGGASGSSRQPLAA